MGIVSPAMPLISVIIPCCNHGKYLPEAIESVLAQSYKNYEIIVVDDGSTDNTESVCKLYPSVRYIRQNNQGLAASRNSGIKLSSGTFLVFLDADDWLLPKALDINIEYLNANPQAAFVSGGHQIVHPDKNVTEQKQVQVDQQHYSKLLEGNYIAMHATILFRRYVFDELKYDTQLPVCEDYDLVLKLARKYPVLHHDKLIAAYRMHGNNMSANVARMLKYSLQILRSQWEALKTDSERQSFKNGKHYWISYYSNVAYAKLSHQLRTQIQMAEPEIAILKQYRPALFYKIKIKKKVMPFLQKLKSFVRRKVQPGVEDGTVNMGDFNRTTPFSTEFGYDRGGPVDRYYIENFLLTQKPFIKGRVLEIGDNEYTLMYGEDRIVQSDILHIDATNEKATYVGDLSDAPMLPNNSFDCIILTQTLHLIYHHVDALKTCYRVLKPGGHLLLTVPGITHIDQGEWKENWLWAFTGSSVKRMLKEAFPAEGITVETYGNVLVATAFLYGLGLPEMTLDQMNDHDPHFQVIITAIAIKPV